MNKNAFVTGACGFIGSNLVKELLSRNWNVIGITKKIPINYLSHNNLKIIEGDILYREQLLEVTKGIDVIFHCAAYISFIPKDFQKSYDINVKGTRNVLEAGLQNRIKKVVHLSAASVLGYTKNSKNIVDEDRKINISKKNPYTFTKRIAEDLVKDYCARGLDASIANITTVYGAGDRKLNSGAIIKLIYKEKIRFAFPGGTSYVSANDLINGLIILSEKGKKGESYTFCTENLTFWELFNRIAKSLNRKPIKAVLPKWTFFPVWGVFSLISPFLRCPTDRVNIVTPQIIKEAYFYKYYSSRKTREELGWRPKIFLEEAVKEALDFYLKEGLV